MQHPNGSSGGPSTPRRLARLLDPESGDLGAWVQLPDGTIGQVWALHKGTRVWVADGTSYMLTDTQRLIVVGVCHVSDDNQATFDLGPGAG